MEETKMTLRMDPELTESLRDLSRRHHRSINGQIVYSLKHQHWTDDDMIDFAHTVLRLPENPPYVLEINDKRIFDALEDFKRRRL